MSYWAAGATIGSALINSAGSSKASKRQEQSVQAAAARLEAANQEGKQLQLPYYNGGVDAFQQLMARLPELTQGYDPSRLLQEPGYEFGRAEGQRSLEGSLAAQGLTDSGAALRRAARYGTDYATTKLGEAFNRDRMSRNDAFGMLTNAAGYGERAGQNIATQGNQTAGRIADLTIGGGNAGAADSAAQGNIFGNLLSYMGSTFKPKAGSSSKGYGTGMGDFQSGGGMTNYLAEGGRVEPVVGTRAPRRAGGGGGGMSRDAVLQALDAAWGQPAPARDGVAALPADPVRNPRAITDDRMRKAGAYANGGAVRGKTPGKADKVTAHLSGGEHVIDAEVVAMLGDGNSEAGHALLDELKRRVREFKRSAPADHTAPAMHGAMHGNG